MNHTEFTAFRLPKELLAEIDKYCHQSNQSRSTLFREALEQFLANKTGNKMEDTR